MNCPRAISSPCGTLSSHPLLFGSLFATIFWSGDLVTMGWWMLPERDITLAICIAFMGGAVGAGMMVVSDQTVQCD